DCTSIPAARGVTACDCYVLIWACGGGRAVCLAEPGSASTIHLLGRCGPAHIDRCDGHRHAGARRLGPSRRRHRPPQLRLSADFPLTGRGDLSRIAWNLLSSSSHSRRSSLLISFWPVTMPSSWVWWRRGCI